MELKKIRYGDLNSLQREIFNFQKVAGLLADYGFNCIKLADDWQGADFLAYHKDGTNTLKVQLKSRMHIARKYEGKDLVMAFPIRGCWYLVEHDRLVQIVGEQSNWLKTPSWLEDGAYSSDNPNKQMVEALAQWKLGMPACSTE